MKLNLQLGQTTRQKNGPVWMSKQQRQAAWWEASTQLVRAGPVPSSQPPNRGKDVLHEGRQLTGRTKTETGQHDRFEWRREGVAGVA